MSTSAKEMLGLSNDSWNRINDAMERALAGTAKCRRVIPKGLGKIDDRTVVVPTIETARDGSIQFGDDTIITPVHIRVDINIDDRHVQNEGDIIQVVATAAAQLGEYEDLEIVRGGQHPPGVGGNPPATPGRFPRNQALERTSLWRSDARPPTAINAAGAAPTGAEVLAVVNNAIAALAPRPGRYGLLVSRNIMAVLKQPLVPGGEPLIQEIEARIGSNLIEDSIALDDTCTADRICGILFRVDPPATDIVHTMLPTLTSLGRTGGLNNLRVEEEISVRILDPAAVQRIAY